MMLLAGKILLLAASAAAPNSDAWPFAILRSYGSYVRNRTFTDRVFAAQERHPGLFGEIWFSGCGDPFSDPETMGRTAAEENLAARERCRKLGVAFVLNLGMGETPPLELAIRKGVVGPSSWSVMRPKLADAPAEAVRASEKEAVVRVPPLAAFGVALVAPADGHPLVRTGVRNERRKTGRAK